MFIQKSISHYSISSFSPHNLSVRFLNQILVIIVTTIFVNCKSIYCCLLFVTIMAFNMLNFKIHFEKDPHLKYVFNNQVDFKLACKNRENIVFKALFFLSAFFLAFKLSKIICLPIASLLPSSFGDLIFEMSDFHERVSYLFWESPEYFIVDTLCQMAVTLIMLVFYFLNKNLNIYYDFYTVEIYKRVFSKNTKYISLGLALALLIYKQFNYFNLNLLDFFENIVMVILMVKLFFKFKVGNYKNLKKYINIMKYLSAFKLALLICVIFLNKIFSNDFDSSIFDFLTSKIDNFLQPNSPSLLMLISLYYLYNLISFNIKFQNLFVGNTSSEFFGTLQNKPYKLQFINYFAKNLLKILKIQDIKSAVRHNLDLRFEFYGKLKKFLYFKKSFEYNLKSTNSISFLSRKYSIYEIWNKYLNIFDIYKWDFLAIVLNSSMILVLGSQVYAVNILSVFYITLALIIVTTGHFKLIWHGSLAFCVVPTLIVISFFSLVSLFRFVQFSSGEVFLSVLLTDLGFEEQVHSIEATLHVLFMVMFVNVAYIICLMLIKNKGGGIKKQYTIVENLRNRRMMVIDADEDILFLISSFCRFAIIVAKLLLILLICKETLIFVDISNTLILGTIFIYLAYNSDFFYSLFVHTYLVTFLARFFSRYDMIFGKFGDHEVMMYGLYYNFPFSDSKIDYEEILGSQQKMFYINFAMVYGLFLIKFLLSKTHSHKFLENKNFKTKYLSIIYNYFVDLFKDSRNVIDSTKISFIYFFIFYYCISSKPSIVIFIEFLYTSFLLIFHMIIYKIQGNVKSWTFFSLFVGYFLFVLYCFSNDYVDLFKFYSSVSINDIKPLDEQTSEYSQNYNILFPYALKIVLSLISLSSIYAELKKPPTVLNNTSNPEEVKVSDVKQKVYYKVLKIVSVFLKEILLFYTSFRFLQKPNFFKFLYLLCYMHYFTTQINSLSRIFKNFKLVSIIKTKILFFKFAILEPKYVSTFNDGEIDLFDPIFEDFNIAFYQLMSKSIFNKIHKKVFKTWIWMFGVVVLYMLTLFFLYYFSMANYSPLLSFILFNLKEYSNKDLKGEFIEVLIILGITVFEIYFIDLLKSPKISSEKEIIKSLNAVILLRYKYILMDCDHPSVKTHTDNMNKFKLGDFGSLFKDMKSIDFKEEHFEIKKHKTSPINNDPSGKIIQNLNHRMKSVDKYILLSHNRSRLAFLQILWGFIEFLKKFIVIPLIIGILFRKSTPFSFSIIALMVLFYSKRNYFALLNTTNRVLIFICLVEYLFIFVLDKSNTTINNVLGSFENYAVQLREHPLSGLPFVFWYTAFIKIFYMVIILICQYALIEIDKVLPEIFQNIRYRVISGMTYIIMDHKKWGHDQYFIFYQLKKIILSTLADVFFIFSLVSYYHITGFVAYFFLIFIMAFKLIFTFVLKKPFSQSMSPTYALSYKILTYLNFIVLICNQIPLNIPLFNIMINNRVFFAVTIILSFSILDCALDPVCQFEKEQAEKFYSIRNQLSILGLVYTRNEKNIMEVIDLEIKNQYLKSQYHKKDSSNKKSSVVGSQDTIEDILGKASVFGNNKYYKEFILDQLSYFPTLTLRAKLWLRKKLLGINSSSSNLLSLFSNYIYKNQPFVKDSYKLDVLRLHRGDYSQIEELMKEVEANKLEIFKNSEANFVSLIRSQIKNIEEPMLINRNRNTTIGLSSPTTAGVFKTYVTNANLFVIKELTVDRMAMQLKEIQDQNFGENFYKYKVSDEEYFILRNFDQISSELNNSKMANFGAKEYFKWMEFLVWVRFELIVTITIIFMLCFGQGFMTTIYIFILMFFILIENRMKNLKYWQFFYLVFMINLIVQLFFNTRFDLIQFNEPIAVGRSNYPSESVASIVMFLFGQVDQDYLVVIFILMEIMLIHLCDNFGWEKTVPQIESNTQAILRVSMHKKSWQYAFNRQNNICVSEISIIEKKLKEKYKAVLNEKEYTIFLVNLIKKKSPIYKTYKEKFIVFLYHLDRLIPTYKIDAHSIKQKFFNNYLWRNFSFTLRKSGRNYHTYQLLTMAVMLFYFLIYFFKMQGLNKTVMDIFKNNEVHAILTINISIIIFAIFIERYLYSRTTLYWTHCTNNERDLGSLKIRLTHFDSIQSQVEHYGLLDRFKRAVRRFVIILRWRSVLKVSPRNAYKHNPLLPKFFFTIFMWAYISFLSIIWIPMASNQQIPGGYMKRIFCNEIYRTEENPVNLINSCNSFSANVYLQLLFLLGNIYLVVAIAQIRRGNSQLSNYKLKNYKNPKEVFKFYAYKYTPYIRELKTIIDYTASHTSLNLFQWFKLEDIETTIMTSQNNEASNRFTGNRLNKIIKRISGVSFLAFFFLLLVAPLYLFSDILPNNIIDEVKTAKMSVMAELETGTYLLYKNTGYTIEKLPRYNILIDKVKLDERLKKFDNDLFRKLTFGISSESYLDITKEIATVIYYEFQRTKKLKLNIILDMETSYRGPLSKKFSFYLDEENANIFLEMISSSTCSKILKNRMILGEDNKLLDLRLLFQNYTNTNQLERLNFKNVYIFNFNCEKDTNKITFELSDEDSEMIEFLVLSENINNSVDLLQQFLDSSVSILSIYAIIFSYIGLTIIRKSFFDQAHIIWTTEMPNAHKLQEHIHMINYARQQGDFYSETMFYNKLIDLFRAPEKIKKLTGPLSTSKAVANRH
jgi:hypothetical protein